MQRPRSLCHTFPVILPTALVLLLLFFLLGGCGSEPTKDEGIPKADQPVIDEAIVAEMGADEFDVVIEIATNRLLEHLGGDEAAFYATLLATDRGYDIYQLLTGSLNDQVEADGRITSADGSLLSPARPAEGIIQPFSDDAGSSTSRESARSSRGPILVASLPGSPLMVAASDPGDRAVVLGVSSLPFRELFDMAGEMWSEQQQRIADDYERAETITDITPEFAETITFITTGLAARGYGVQQIVESIVLSQVRVKVVDVVGGGTYFCWHIEHTSGVVLRPVHPPATPELIDVARELACPGASEDAPTSFSPEDVEAAVAGAAGDMTSSGGESGSDSDSAEDGPGSSQEDAGGQSVSDTGYEDGLYVGRLTWWAGESIVEMLSDEARVQVRNGRVDGQVRYVAKVLAPNPDHPNRIMRCTLTAPFTGAIDEEGEIRGTGTCTTEWELISCEHPDGVPSSPCDFEGTETQFTVIAHTAGGYVDGDLYWGDHHTYSFDGELHR